MSISDSMNWALVVLLCFRAIARAAYGPIPTVRPWPQRDEIIAYLDELLDAGSFDDYGPNGLQVPGADEVEQVVTAVSAAPGAVRAGRRAGAQLVLCHHGIFWGGSARPDRRADEAPAEDAVRRRPVAGRLPPAARRARGGGQQRPDLDGLGFEPAEPFAAAKGRPIGWVGRCRPSRCPSTTLLDRCARAVRARRRSALPRRARRRSTTLGVVSGGGAGELAEAAALGLDAFVTGEPSEPAMADARETGIHFIAGGHWATETFGIRRLGELLAERVRGRARVPGAPKSGVKPSEFRMEFQAPQRHRIDAQFRNCSESSGEIGNNAYRYKSATEGDTPMAIHLTPTELARESGMHRREVILKCMELGVPIFQGRIDKTLFECFDEGSAGTAAAAREGVAAAHARLTARPEQRPAEPAGPVPHRQIESRPRVSLAGL